MLCAKNWLDQGPRPECPICRAYVWRTPTREHDGYVHIENDQVVECCGCRRIFVFRHTSGFSESANSRVSVFLVSEHDEGSEAVPI